MINESIPKIAEEIAAPLGAIAPPQRIAILLAIGKNEACVCHLEAALGWRQAYISQHLMALRRANILTDRRKGRYVFYRLKDPSLLDIILNFARLGRLPAEAISDITNTEINPSCECPQCVPAFVSAISP